MLNNNFPFYDFFFIKNNIFIFKIHYHKNIIKNL